MQVQVGIDKPGQQVHAGDIQLAPAVQGRAVLGIDRQLRETDDLHLGDAIVLHDDIDRPLGRRARAVDHVGAAQHQALERSFALVPLWNGDDLRRLRLGTHGGKHREDGHGRGGDDAPRRCCFNGCLFLCCCCCCCVH